jgi:hypothetical protein
MDMMVMLIIYGVNGNHGQHDGDGGMNDGDDPSSTTILNHHPQPSSSTTILNHHPQLPSSTIIPNHHP